MFVLQAEREWREAEADESATAQEKADAWQDFQLSLQDLLARVDRLQTELLERVVVSGRHIGERGVLCCLCDQYIMHDSCACDGGGGRFCVQAARGATRAHCGQRGA